MGTINESLRPGSEYQDCNVHDHGLAVSEGALCTCQPEPQHVPTPWHLRNESTEIAYSDGELVSYIAGMHVGTICPEHGTAEATAAFIVKAVNAYESNQKAFRDINYILSNGGDIRQAMLVASKAIAEAL